MAAAALYDVPKTVGQRETNVGALLVFGLILCAASAVGTQVVAERLQYHSALGKPLFHASLPYLRSVYVPWAWAQWCITFLNPLSHVRYTPAVYAALATLPYTLGIGTFVAIIGLGLTAALTNKREDVVETIDSGRWATARDIEREGFFRQAGPVIGAFERKRGQVLPLRFDGQNGIEHVAVPGDDKTTQLKTSMLISLQRDVDERIAEYGDTEDGRRADFWGEEPSIVALDVKGSLIASTSAYQRNELGKETFILEPLSESTEGRASFNPFWSLRIGTLFEAGDCYQAAYDLTPTGSKDLPTYWDAACVAFGSAIIGTLAYRALQKGNYELLSLPSLVDYISSRRAIKAADAVLDENGVVITEAVAAKDAIQVLIDDMLEPHDPHFAFGWKDLNGDLTDVRPWIVSAALGMEAKEAEERSGVYGTFLERLGVFRDEVLRQHISTSSFSFRDLANRPKPGIVYLNIPAMKLNHYRIFISIFVRTAIRDLTERTANLNGQEVRGNLRSTLLVLDEIATLGRDPEIATSSGYLRGHGAMILALWQSEQQKLQHYGDHESLTPTMGVHVFGRPERPADAELLSKALGQFSTVVTKRNSSTSRDGKQFSETAEISTRSLLTPTEVKRLPRTENIVFSRGLTIRALKFPYYKDPVLAQRAEMGAVKESDTMSLKPFFVENLERLFGADLIAKLRQPIAADEKKPEAAPPRVIMARIDDPAEAFAAGIAER